jgi:hypothetical protein
MAFEIPLDADRVDDFNLFSTLIRAPVIGTLFWMFGGNSSKGGQQNYNNDDDDEGRDFSLDDNLLYEDSSFILQSSVSRKGECCNRQHHATTLKKAVPSLIASEISESEIVESLDAVSLYGYTGSYSSNYSTGIGKKELSWSDDVGKNLIITEAEVSQQRRTNTVCFCTFWWCTVVRFDVAFQMRHGIKFSIPL